MQTISPPLKHPHCTDTHSGAVAEITGLGQIKQSFKTLFPDVAVLQNIILTSPDGAAVKTNEMDVVVVCNAGVFIFEIKGWSKCTISRTRTADGWDWTMTHAADGHVRQIKDPIKQIGGKHKTIMPYLRQAVLTRWDDMSNDIFNEVGVLGTPQLARSARDTMTHTLAKTADEPHIRTRTYVLAPMADSTLDLSIPPNVINGRDLPYLVRTLAHEVLRKESVHMPFTQELVGQVSQALLDASAKHSRAEHLQNINEVHGCVDPQLLETMASHEVKGQKRPVAEACAV